MKVVVLSVGKPRDTDAALLHDRYAERIRKLGVAYQTRFVPETKSDGKYSADHVRQRETGSLLERLGSGGKVIALDRTGAMLDSEALSRSIQRWLTPEATFVIGGPLGLHPELLQRADSCWSLSALTLPHELARVVMAEQIYRALTILKRIPYHK